MADRHAISQLFADYAWYTDLRDAEAIGALYTDDGEMTIEITGGDRLGPLAPRRGIVEFVGAAMAAHDDQRRHVITNLRYESEEQDAATVTAILSLFVTDAGELVVQATGLYRADIVRGEHGAWRLRRMHLTLDRPY